MILEIFALLVGLSLFAIALGHFTADGKVYGIVGYALLFFLSSTIILSGNLEYRQGETRVISWLGNGTVNSTTETITPTVINWTGNAAHFFGIWLSIASAMACYVMLAGLKGGLGPEG